MIKRIRLGGILGSLRWVFFIFLPLGFLKGAETPIPVQTVFIILMENHDRSTILGSPNCPYINNTLLPMASHCEQYYNPPGIHPSEPNYLWLVAGTNFGITNDKDPSINHQSSTNTLFLQLDRAGISWKTYQENISGLDCPDTNAYPYAVRHDPFVFFDAVRNDLAYCTNHVRPYTELQQDLQNNRVARYNFITPNVTNDMHDSLSGVSRRLQGADRDDCSVAQGQRGGVCQRAAFHAQLDSAHHAEHFRSATLPGRCGERHGPERFVWRRAAAFSVARDAQRDFPAGRNEPGGRLDQLSSVFFQSGGLGAGPQQCGHRDVLRLQRAAGDQQPPALLPVEARAVKGWTLTATAAARTHC